MTRAWGLAGALALVCLRAWAVDWTEFPELRHTSGLPGNGFGVDPEGKVGFGGAFHCNVPCAYTPALGEVALAYYSASNDSSIRFELGGDKTDSTGCIGVGLGRPGHSVYVGQVFVQEDLGDNCQNLQWQVLDETVDNPAVAIGVLDVFDRQDERQGKSGGARSFYIVATRRAPETHAPLYVSLGFGTGRFGDGLFGGLSWYSGRLNLGFEYDGFVPRPHVAYRLTGAERQGLGVALGWSNFDRPVLGLDWSFSF